MFNLPYNLTDVFMNISSILDKENENFILDITQPKTPQENEYTKKILMEIIDNCTLGLKFLD